MFSFKPRVYRSVEGCCICRAKSSSSRFTDSRKYEEDSIKCFDLKYPRNGEICNACVLLVKRYKRLPAGSQRNWSHVVDARAGPGTKTFMKAKRIKEENYSNNCTQARHISKSIIAEKFHKIFKKSKKIRNQSTSKNFIESSLTNELITIESNNENASRESSPELSYTNISPHNVVFFQTQTRASAFRAKHSNKRSIITKSMQANALKSLPKLVGTKKRKKFKPRRLDVSYEDQYNFFDENEWKQINTCCGIFYECDKLNGAIMIDVDQYKVCSEHGKEITDVRFDNQKTFSPMQEQKCLTRTKLPEVVPLSLPFTTTMPANINSNIKSPTVLKKHQLFFKRQSEMLKTDVCALAAADIDNEITCLTNTLKQNEVQQQQQQHSIATPTVTTVPLAATSNIKSSSFLHKIKSDAGKIVKHSVNKFSAAIRLKNQDLSEIKHIAKTADKNLMLSKALTTTATTQTNSTVMTTTPLTDDNLSPSSTSSSTTSSNKFSDNSSDSGFDENDRKSVSPLQQENTKNIATRPPVQTLILTNGVRVNGQPQNVVYAGNDLSAKILQQQNASTLSSSAVLQHNKLLNVQSNESTQLAASLKILQTKSNTNGVISIGSYNLSGAKICTIYNKNAIKHENGITTIVPASSFTATNKCTVQTNAPNTITITPASSASLQKRPITIPINYQQHNA